MSRLTFGTRSGVSDRRPLASGESIRVERLDVEASADARKSGDAPKMKEADCRPMALGESMLVERLDGGRSVDRQRCGTARKSGEAARWRYRGIELPVG